MSIEYVRKVEVFQAVHMANPDWKEVVRKWAEGFEGPNQIEDMQQFHDFIRAAEEQNEGIAGDYWLLYTEAGLQFVPPAAFSSWYESVNPTSVLDEVWLERKNHLIKGYDSKHDDAQPLSHLLDEARSHMEKFGETPTDDFIRGELIVAASLLIAAIDKVDRTYNITTFGV